MIPFAFIPLGERRGVLGDALLKVGIGETLVECLSGQLRHVDTEPLRRLQFGPKTG